MTTLNSNLEGPADSDLTIVVVTYNNEDSIEDCVNSLLSQDGIDLDIIIVDNDSSDRTRDIVSKYEHVALVENEDNVGFPRALNRGFSLATTHYVGTVNPDTTLDSSAMERLLEPVSAGRADITTPKILLADNPEQMNTAGSYDHFTGLSFTRGFGRRLDVDEFSEERPLPGVSGAVFVTSSEQWELFGGFDERLFMYGDDTSLSWESILRGWDILFVPDSVVYHDYDLNISGWKFYHLERGRYLILLNYYPPNALVLLPSLLLTECMSWITAMSIGVSGIWAKIRSYAVLLDPDSWAHRGNHRSSRERFPERFSQFEMTLPWDMLVRQGVLPDTGAVRWIGQAFDKVYELNANVYEWMT